MITRKTEFSVHQLYAQKYEKEYIEERNKIPDFMLSKDIHIHLSSFDSFVEWKKKNEKLFNYDDKAREL